ncbi:cytochrome c3 family protein [Enterobacillus tribolii]|uniref:Cytochrome c3-like protein n=1 Tax=Enterobacillus tribolii TaxID=1487935 RepID=A0A370Q698_9GAMM|nr:cytochrome c3 family protein [Enterobacillus tribolii]MBW7984982.1 cytochrome C [Enterobacillus tribolii]RDK83878.1 cytochrome c3-like protein [Enterobacillus tribolii]
MTKIWTALLMLLAGMFTAPLFAADGEAAFHQRLNDMNVKSYHQSLGATGRDTSCQLCHGTKTPVSAPDDRTCLNCHGSRDQVAALTLPDPKDKNAEPNPHDSMHYGKDAPCTMCHNEHRPSEIYCNSCHLFKYPNMKP